MINSTVFFQILKKQNKLLFSHIITIILFSIIYYFIAPIKGSKKDQENFQNIEDSIYYTTLTHFTIGYGDIAPESQIMRRLTILQVLIAFVLMNL
jgi:hypothetical protein